MLPLIGKPLGNDPAVGGRASEELQYILTSTYGHLGPKVVEYLVQNRDSWDALRALFQDSRTKYAEVSSAAVGRRHAAHLAILELSSRIVGLLGIPEPTYDPFEYLIEIMDAVSRDADRPLAAMQELVSWCATNSNKFHGRHQHDTAGAKRIPHSGWAGVWPDREDWRFIGVTSVTLRRTLIDANFDPTEIIERWARRKWLVGGDARNLSRSMKVNGVSIRCYCIKRSVYTMVTQDMKAEIE